MGLKRGNIRLYSNGRSNVYLLGDSMKKGQIPVKSVSDEIYDKEMSAMQRERLQREYQTFMESLDQEDASELRRYLLK